MACEFASKTFQPSTQLKMPVSSAKAVRQAKRAADGKKTPLSKARDASKEGSQVTSKASSVNGDDPPMLDGDEVDGLNGFEEGNEQMKKLTLQEDSKTGISDRVTTGVLASIESSRDVKISSASLVFHGKVLFNDANLEVSFGRRYGLLGENGCGKSTLLKAIDKREFPFPDHLDIYLLNEGAPKTDSGALEWVVKQAELEMQRLEEQAEGILESDGPDAPALQDVYDVSETDECNSVRLMCTPADRIHGSHNLSHSGISHIDRSWLQ